MNTTSRTPRKMVCLKIWAGISQQKEERHTRVDTFFLAKSMQTVDTCLQIHTIEDSENAFLRCVLCKTESQPYIMSLWKRILLSRWLGVLARSQSLPSQRSSPSSLFFSPICLQSPPPDLPAPTTTTTFMLSPHCIHVFYHNFDPQKRILTRYQNKNLYLIWEQLHSEVGCAGLLSPKRVFFIKQVIRQWWM